MYKRQTIGGTLGVTGQITGNITGDLTGTADKSDLADITDTTTTDATFYPTFVSAVTGYSEMRVDSTNLTYNPYENRLTVANFRSTTDFEVQGNLTVTGALTYFVAQVGSIANHDTDALAEGTTNLYFTDERVDDRVAALVDGGTGISATYDDANNLLSLAVDFGEINTDDLTEGSSNRFFTQARTRNAFTYGTGIQHDGSGTLSVTQSDIDTDNVTEGSTNIFFTDARARGAFSVTGDLGYNASTGVFSFTERTDAEVNALADARIAAATTDDLSEGSTNVYYTNTRADARVNLQTGANLDLSQKDTGDLSEGSNLYYTNERVDDRVAALISGGTGISATYNDAGNLLTLSADFGEFDTSNITEGSNLYYTNARADARIAAASVTDLSDVDQAVATTDSPSFVQLTSTIATGTAPFVVASTTKVVNLNADRLDGMSTHSSAQVSSIVSRDASGDFAANVITASLTGNVTGQVSDISNHDTGDLAEGTNLYYTQARVDARIGTLAATAAQGALADSATQPGDLATVATSGSYNDLANLPTLFSGAYADLTGKPTLGTAAATASTDYATAAQGATADSALQAETLSLADLKAVVAASSSFSDFQSRVAAL